MKVSRSVLISHFFQPHEAGIALLPCGCSYVRKSGLSANNLPIFAAINPYLSMATQTHLPEFVLFGASMTEWSFDEKTHGLGWFLASKYEGKVLVLNEGTRAAI